MKKLTNLFFLVAMMMMVNMMIDPIHVERHFRVNTCTIGNRGKNVFKKRPPKFPVLYLDILVDRSQDPTTRCPQEFRQASKVDHRNLPAHPKIESF